MAVCDGFTGNIILKTTEGLAKLFMSEIKGIFMKSLPNKLAAAVVKKDLGTFKRKFDSAEYGGALLLGTFLASLAGVLGYGFLGLFSSLDGIGADPLLGLLLGLGGLMGSYLGARCQRFVPARRIKWGLALILLFTSLRYLWQGF